jgi:putative hydrolase of the HAD superfamily
VTDAIVFDLGNTLAAYFTRAEWPGVLRGCVDRVRADLQGRGMLRVDPADLPARIEAERGPTADHAVVPLQDRLARIFRLSQADFSDGAAEALCRRFMEPIFSLGRLYDDVLPTLTALRRRGLKTGIVSNTPWGSPAALWREELARLGLAGRVDVAVFCGDAGFRKPARPIFDAILGRLGVDPARSLFVGDDPRWDVAGSRDAGMDALLIDRHGEWPDADAPRITGLSELLERV